MRRFKLFKGKSQDDTPIFRNDLVGCLGKLPLHREFIKHNITRPELAALDLWYQGAYHAVSRQYKDKTKEVFSQMPLHHFLYVMDEGRQLMVGTLIASRDQSGRCYPFTLFRMLENPVAHEFPSIVPLIYRDYYRETERICKEVTGDQSLSSLFQRIDLLNQTASHYSRRQALEIAVTALENAGLKDYNHPDASSQRNAKINEHITGAIANLESIKTALADASYHTLRFPLPANAHNEATITFWLQLITSIIPTKDARLQLFWTTGGTYRPPSLTVFFKPMPPECLTFLVDPARSS